MPTNWETFSWLLPCHAPTTHPAHSPAMCSWWCPDSLPYSSEPERRPAKISPQTTYRSAFAICSSLLGLLFGSILLKLPATAFHNSAIRLITFMILCFCAEHRSGVERWSCEPSRSFIGSDGARDQYVLTRLLKY